MSRLYIKEFRRNGTSLEIIIWKKMCKHGSCGWQASERWFWPWRTFSRGRLPFVHSYPGRHSFVVCPGLPIFRPYWAEPQAPFHFPPVIRLWAACQHTEGLLCNYISEGLRCSVRIMVFIFNNFVSRTVFSLFPFPRLKPGSVDIVVGKGICLVHKYWI